MSFKIGDIVRVLDTAICNNGNKIGKVCGIKPKGHRIAYKKYGEIKYITASVDYVTVELYDDGKRWHFRADEIEHMIPSLKSNKEFRRLWDFLTDEN